jgi:hypothetical protein
VVTRTKHGKHQRQCKAQRKGIPTQSKAFERKINAEQWAQYIRNEVNRSLIELAAQSHAAQEDFLSGILGKGIPVTYRDDQGDLLKELPDGKIGRIMEAS